MRQRRLQPFIDDTLVRGVLVDDDEAVARLRHDVSFVHLRTRRSERVIEGVATRRSKRIRFKPEVGAQRRRGACRRCADVKRSLRAVCEADTARP